MTAEEIEKLKEWKRLLDSLQGQVESLKLACAQQKYRLEFYEREVELAAAFLMMRYGFDEAMVESLSLASLIERGCQLEQKQAVQWYHEAVEKTTAECARTIERYGAPTMIRLDPKPDKGQFWRNLAAQGVPLGSDIGKATIETIHPLPGEPS